VITAGDLDDGIDLLNQGFPDVVSIDHWLSFPLSSPHRMHLVTMIVFENSSSTTSLFLNFVTTSSDHTDRHSATVRVASISHLALVLVTLIQQLSS